MIDKSLCFDILELALKSGADFAEIFGEVTERNAIEAVNGKIKNVNGGIDQGVGLRLIFGEKVVYVYTNDISKENLFKLADKAASSNIGSRLIMPEELIEKSYITADAAKRLSKREIADILLEGSRTAFEFSPLITQTDFSHADVRSDILIANSKGKYVTDKRVRTRASIRAVASNESEKQTGYFGPGRAMGDELYDIINVNDIAREAALAAKTMLLAKDCPSGKMPVIIGNGFGGVIFHEACGHGLEANSIARNASVFCGKLGERIASEKVSAYDDATLQGSWGSIAVDDEGVEGQNKLLIENGILKGYMVDEYNGKKIGLEPTGSSRRQSYKFIPCSRMTNTFIAAGKDRAEDLISSISYGLYAKNMGGGSVNPASGEFNFAVNEAYIIRNGRIEEPVRGAMLIGKGSEVLFNIDGVSDDLLLAEGMCGSQSGSVPVCVGQPLIRVKEITVGGRG